MPELLVEVARSALELSYPEEADEAEAAWNRHRHQGTRVRTPVGMGVDLLPLADHLLPALAVLFGAASGRVAERATDALSDRTKTALARLRNRPAEVVEPLDPAQEREVYQAVVTALGGVVTAEEAPRLAHGVVGALRLRTGRER